MSPKNISFDATAKTFYGNLFKGWGLSVETEREIFSHSRRIDLVVSCQPAEQKKLRDTVFSYFRELNAIELKGINDPLNVRDFNRIMMRAWGLGAVDFSKKTNEKAPSRLPNQRTLTIVCVSRPKKILDDLQSVFAFKATEQQGIYLAEGRLDTWLIHPSELALSKRNYPLLTLARGKKLEQFIALCLREGLTAYLKIIGYLGFANNPDIIWQKIAEVLEMQQTIREETWPFIEDFFHRHPEAETKLPTIQRYIHENRQKGIEKGIEKGLRKGKQEAKQNALIRQLTLKFRQVPESTIETIQKTTQPERLDHWLDQIILVNRLEEMDFD